MGSKSEKGKGGRFEPGEREFIKSVYPGMGPAEIARKLGRSKSGVCKLIKQMKGDGEIAAPKSTKRSTDGPPEGFGDSDGPQDTIGRLRSLRSLLERSMRDADPGKVARISAEYRAVIDDIARIEGQGAGCDDGFDALAESFRAIARKA